MEERLPGRRGAGLGMTWARPAEQYAGHTPRVRVGVQRGSQAGAPAGRACALVLSPTAPTRSLPAPPAVAWK